MPGRKDWTVGEEVLEADFQGFVQDQTVSQFPNVAARDAWTAPPKGALCVTTDTNKLWLRAAAAWFAVLPHTVAGTAVGTIAAGGAGLNAFSIPFGVTFAAVPAATGCVLVGGNLDLILNWQGVTPSGLTARVLTRTGGTVGAPTNFTIHWQASGLLA